MRTLFLRVVFYYARSFVAYPTGADLVAPGLRVLNDEVRPLGLALTLPKSGISLAANALIPLATPRLRPHSATYTIQGTPLSLDAGLVYGGAPSELLPPQADTTSTPSFA